MMQHNGVSAPLSLALFGPIVEVVLGPTKVAAQAIIAAGGKPEAVRARMMVDTGAQTTVIDASIAKKLGLPPLRMSPIIGVAGKPEQCPF